MNLQQKLRHPVRMFAHWQYKNTSLLIVSLFMVYFLVDNPLIGSSITKIGQLGYVGAFVTGLFFVSTFTVAPAMVVLFHLAETLNPFEVAVFAGFGAVAGDYLIFRFLKDRIYDELRPIFLKFGGSRLKSLFRTPYFAWLTPLIGAVIIASPLPDEVGVGILGISKMKNWQFLALSFLLNAVGILIIVTIARSI